MPSRVLKGVEYSVFGNKKNLHLKWKKKLTVLFSVLLFAVCVFLIFGGKDLFRIGKKPDMTGYVQEINESLRQGKIGELRDTMTNIEKPISFEDFYLFAAVAANDGDYASAENYLKECVSLYSGSDPGLAELYFRQGCIYAMQNKWEEAHSSFKEGIALNDSNADYRYMLAEAEYNTGNYQNAVDSTAKALALGCDDREGLYDLRAKSNYILGRFSSAREDALQCISCGGNYVENMTFIAACYEAEADYDSMVGIFLKMIDEGKEDQSVYQNALNAAFKSDNFEAQEKIITRLLQYETDKDTETYLRSCLGTAQLRLNKYEEAEKNFNFCLDGKEEDFRLVYQRGICRLYLMKYDMACDDFARVIAADVMTDEGLFYRALCYLGKGNNYAAETELHTIIDRQQNQEMMEAAELLLEELDNEKKE